VNECLRKAGLSTLREKLCLSLEEAMEFCHSSLGMNERDSFDYDGPSCVVRSPFGYGTHTIPRCNTLHEVKEEYESIKDGEKIVQEFLEGVEHVVDIVSRDGIHKVAAAWRCDKRRIYSTPFSMYATHLAHPHTNVEARMACEYAMEVLNALGVRWGLLHINVMVNRVNQCDDFHMCCKLIDIKYRQHNIDLSLTTRCIGYNSLDMLLVSYMVDIPGLIPRPTSEHDTPMVEWSDLPKFPQNIRAYSAVLHLVSNLKGSIMEGIHRGDILEIPSVDSVCLNKFTQSSDEEADGPFHVNKRDDAGSIYMINEDPMQFQKDYLQVIELLPDFITVK